MLTPTDQVIANAINQEEFRGFSMVNPDYGKLTLTVGQPPAGQNNLRVVRQCCPVSAAAEAEKRGKRYNSYVSTETLHCWTPSADYSDA